MNDLRRVPMVTNVLVGVDGRQGGRDAIALARQLTPAGGRITLAHIYPPIAPHLKDADPRTASTKMLSDERAAAAIDAELLAAPGSSAGGVCIR